MRRRGKPGRPTRGAHVDVERQRRLLGGRHLLHRHQLRDSNGQVRRTILNARSVLSLFRVCRISTDLAQGCSSDASHAAQLCTWRHQISSGPASTVTACSNHHMLRMPLTQQDLLHYNEPCCHRDGGSLLENCPGELIAVEQMLLCEWHTNHEEGRARGDQACRPCSLNSCTNRRMLLAAPPALQAAPACPAVLQCQRPDHHPLQSTSTRHARVLPYRQHLVCSAPARGTQCRQKHRHDPFSRIRRSHWSLLKPLRCIASHT